MSGAQQGWDAAGRRPDLPPPAAADRVDLPPIDLEDPLALPPPRHEERVEIVQPWNRVTPWLVFLGILAVSAIVAALL